MTETVLIGNRWRRSTIQIESGEEVRYFQSFYANGEIIKTHLYTWFASFDFGGSHNSLQNRLRSLRLFVVRADEPGSGSRRFTVESRIPEGAGVTAGDDSA
jgi:hypothetical protein